MGRAFIWTTIDKVSSQLILFGTQLILGRLLRPEDFGLVAMIAIFIAVARSLVDSGLGTALIQRKNLSKKEIDTAFVSNVSIAVMIYLLLYLLAPRITMFFEEEQLTILIRLIGVSFVVQSFFITSNALLIRNLQFKELAIINIGAATISGIVSVIYAYIQRNVFALVLFQVVNMALRAILVRFYTNYRIQIRFSYDSFKSLFKYSGNLLIVGVIEELFRYLYVIAIGKLFDDYTTGLYSMSNNIVLYACISISVIIEKVSLPVLSRMYHDGIEDFRAKYLLYLELISFLLYPLLFGMLVSANNLIPFLLGEKWNDSIEIFQLITIAAMVFPIKIMSITYFKVCDKTRGLLFASSLGKLLNIIFILITYKFGLYYLLLGNVIVSFITVNIYLYFVSRDGFINVFMQMKHQMIYLIAAIVMAGGIILLNYSELKFVFLFQVALGLILYPLVIRIFSKVKLNELLSLLTR